MFLSMKFAAASHCNPSLLFHQHHHHHHQGFGDFSGGSSLRRRTSTLKLQTTLCSTYTNDNAYELSSANSHEGSKESAESKKKEESSTSNEILTKLRRYGISGILSYGLLNTAYYLTTFLIVWFYIAPAPGRMGYLAAVERFLKVMAMVWAGSQVTKLIRAGGALALAPFVDRGLSWFTAKFKFQSQGKAFMTIVGFCVGLAIILFLVITLLWA
ncbi:hypothetical protein HN51_033300 [Arachis hypogaea]|uniref:uncharacterized protein isoform X1 n=1 Tax=Arachis hypogaea TaxID=3818 RepID=UPI000DEC46B8|nr:uncharacterized protein LOC112716930 isoform X1 [Arachis hypogaea]QHO17782.1 uncharacterized protein DS421_10g315040 [Arachis hypogaea]